MKVQIDNLGHIVSVNAEQPRDDCEILDIELPDEVMNNINGYIVRQGKVVINDENSKEQQNNVRQLKAKHYLDATDFYLTRKVETGEDVPKNVLSQRAKARALLTTELPEFE